jgi:hypothetical protein
VAREDHTPPLEDLFPAMVAGASRETPSTVAGEGWWRRRELHAPESETHSLVRAGHAPMQGRRKRPWLGLAKTDDDGEHYREACV